MRILLPTAALLLVAAPALASSIEPVTSRAVSSGPSVETVSCDGCPPLKLREKGATYQVDAIEPGTQKVEIREVNGEKKLFRTEAWWGGSPAVYVSKAPEPDPTADTADAKDGTADTIDMAATTGALDASVADTKAHASGLVGAKALDASGFELRAN